MVHTPYSHADIVLTSNYFRLQLILNNKSPMSPSSPSSTSFLLLCTSIWDFPWCSLLVLQPSLRIRNRNRYNLLCLTNSITDKHAKTDSMWALSWVIFYLSWMIDALMLMLHCLFLLVNCLKNMDSRVWISWLHLQIFWYVQRKMSLFAKGNVSLCHSYFVYLRFNLKAMCKSVLPYGLFKVLWLKINMKER